MFRARTFRAHTTYRSSHHFPAESDDSFKDEWRFTLDPTHTDHYSQWS